MGEKDVRGGPLVVEGHVRQDRVFQAKIKRVEKIFQEKEERVMTKSSEGYKASGVSCHRSPECEKGVRVIMALMRYSRK